MNTLLVRADANPVIGTGHVMRCLALAQAWQDQGGSVTFACAEGLPEVAHQRLSSESMSVRLFQVNPGSEADARAVIELARQVQMSVVVVDGYYFGADYQRWLKDAGLRLLFIDDNGHAEHYYADWVLNQNIHASESLYPSREAYTQLLLGTDYTLLRREFWRWRGWRHEIQAAARNILITMGGSDPDNVTLTILQAVAQMPDAGSLHVKVVVGGSNPHRAELEAFVEQAPETVELMHDVTDMPALMAWADLAVSAGGSTVWELCLMGVPSVVIVTADNQLGIAHGLHKHEACIFLGETADVTPGIIASNLQRLITDREKRHELAANAQNLVDGKAGLEIIGGC